MRLSTSYVGLTSLNSMIFVLASEAAYLTRVMNSPARKPRGDGDDVPGASAERTTLRSKPKNVFSDELWPMNFCRICSLISMSASFRERSNSRLIR